MMLSYADSARGAIIESIKRRLLIFDRSLAIIVGLIMLLGCLAVASAAMDYPGRFEGHVRNIAVGIMVMWIAAVIPPQKLMRFALPIYLAGLGLLVAVAMFGLVKNGARRWLNVGVIIQPSEIMKLALPLMLAWYFQRREGMIRWRDFLVAAVLVLAPVALILRQPDLGTAMLVLSSGFFVIFLAGLSWRFIIGMMISGLASLPLVWSMLHDYQRGRVMTLIDPTSDPLGKGFHIIQSTIAIGSGGLIGKGWLNGSQAHLEFIPERTTDFIFAVFSEEFGLLGNAVLLVLYLMLIGRGLLIAANAPTLFSRLLAGAITLSIFVYAFVNMGMVSGILPVVGVPLPFMSYGGTAFVTLSLAVGTLMSIQRHRKLVQT
ncbi:MAG: rod shape-determining protein RodA [Oxalobacteraceae bacterium]|jgi:rod shape determining protein RodA|nr:rod shape-determining protein RodA [Oxalobacteraceae bacterium]